MANINVRVRLNQDAEAIKTKILYATRRRIDEVLKRSYWQLRDEIGIMVRTRLEASPVWSQLLSGLLRYHLGIANAQPAMDEILDTIQRNVVINRTDRGVLGGFEVRILRSDFSDLLELPHASYISESKKGHTQINWLEWLLFRGTDVIVQGYQVLLGRQFAEFSRTDFAIMGKTKGESWGLNLIPEMAGTENDNFITRALTGIEEEVKDKVREVIKSNF